MHSESPDKDTKKNTKIKRETTKTTDTLQKRMVMETMTQQHKDQRVKL